jgi:hypothetical protein
MILAQLIKILTSAQTKFNYYLLELKYSNRKRSILLFIYPIQA